MDKPLLGASYSRPTIERELVEESVERAGERRSDVEETVTEGAAMLLIPGRTEERGGGKAGKGMRPEA